MSSCARGLDSGVEINYSGIVNYSILPITRDRSLVTCFSFTQQVLWNVWFWNSYS